MYPEIMLQKGNCVEVWLKKMEVYKEHIFVRAPEARVSIVMWWQPWKKSCAQHH